MEIYKAILEGKPAAESLRDAISAQGVSVSVINVDICGCQIRITYMFICENGSLTNDVEARFTITPVDNGFKLEETSYIVDGEIYDEKFGMSDLMIDEALCEEIEE